MKPCSIRSRRLKPSAQIDGIDETAYGRDAIRREPGASGMLPDSVLIRGDVNAVDFVLSHVAVQPVNLRTGCIQRRQRAQGYLTELSIRQASGATYLTFDHELRHNPEITPNPAGACPPRTSSVLSPAAICGDVSAGTRDATFVKSDCAHRVGRMS